MTQSLLSWSMRRWYQLACEQLRRPMQQAYLSTVRLLLPGLKGIEIGMDSILVSRCAGCRKQNHQLSQRTDDTISSSTCYEMMVGPRKLGEVAETVD